MPARTIRSCFVTGGTGFIGSHLVDLLLDDGLEVRCLVRDRSKPRWLEGKSVTLIEGDLEATQSLRNGASGADAVFHVAGRTAARTAEEYFRVNAEGSCNVARAMRQAQPRPGLFVYVSSLAALGPAGPDDVVEETGIPRPVTLYGKSKLEGERRLRAVEDLPLLVIRPPAVYGPRDRELLPLFRWAARGLLPVFNSSARISLIHVEDLVRGIVAAAQRAPVGTAYHIAHPVALKAGDFPGLFGKALGRRVRGVAIPGPLLGAAAAGSELWGLLNGHVPVLNRGKVRELTAAGWVSSTAMAEKDLGFRARIGAEEGLGNTVQWYRQQGWL